MGKKSVHFTDEVLHLIAQRFKAMSDPTRLKIIQLLRERESCVGEIAEEAGLKHGTASANLNALQRAGIVVSRKDGTKVMYRIGSEMVFKICDGVCESLKQELEEMDKLRKTME